jgi:glucan biosynthesis protein C
MPWRAVWRRPADQHDGRLPSHLSIAAFALAVGLVTFVVRIWLPVSWIFEPLGLPVALFPQYVALFAAGMVAHRRNWLTRIGDRTGKVWAGVAAFFIVVLLPLVFVLGGALEGGGARFMGGLHWQALAYAVWEQFVAVGMILALLVWFRSRFNSQGRVTKAMSECTYAVYFIHAPILVYLALALRDIRLYPLLKFALVAPVGVSLCFVVAYGLRQLPLVRRVL